MNSKKEIVRAIIFIIIGICMFQILTIIFVPKWTSQIDPATPRWQEFYGEEKNTIDVLLIGSSDVGRGLSPITLWKEYGITSFNLGTSNQTMSLSYYVIKEALEHQNPKTIVLDMDALFAKKNAPEGEYRKLFDNMKFGKNKIDAITEKALKVENKLSYIFPIMRFHSRWSDLSKKDIKFYHDYSKTLSYKGMAINDDIKPYIDDKKYMGEKGEKETILPVNVEFTEKIIELCKKEDIKLLMIEIPSASSWSKARSEATYELAQKHNMEFIDMNYLQEEMNFNWLTDTADKGNHLNIYGAEKVSKYLGEILTTKYHVTDHRKDDKYKKWNDEVIRYENDKSKLKNDIDKQKNKKENLNNKVSNDKMK